MNPVSRMAPPRLSVIVPNYNHAGHLPACLNALLAQSVPATEILVIDDGSTDNSVKVMMDLQRQHPVIKVYENGRNCGVVYTMNRGVKLAQGEYLYLAAADDEVQPGLFENSLELLAQHPRAALSCTISQWRDEGSGLTWLMGAGVADRPCYLSPDELVERERQGRLMIVSHSAVIKASVVREFEGFRKDLKWHSDWFLTYAAAFRYGLCFVPQVLSHVLQKRNSYYGAGRRKADHQAVMELILELLQEDRYRDVAARIRSSGALGLHATPMLYAMLRNPASRCFITPLFLRKCAVRSTQMFARRYFPDWLARLCIKLFTPQRLPVGAERS
jgi:glycosyltransferase involved in cell wall biosynthesis